MLKLNIIICSTRPGRVGPTVARWVHEAAKENGKFDAQLVDLADFNLPVYDEPKHPRLKQYEHDHTKAWSESVASADAFAFVLPEYNFFPPSSLINALQYVLGEWHYKPAGLVSYGGVSGGLRSAQTVKLVLTSLKMMPLPEQVPIPTVSQLIENGVFKPNELITTGATTMFNELHRWSEALKPLRAG